MPELDPTLVETIATARAAVVAPDQHGQLCPVWTRRTRGAKIEDCDCWILRNARSTVRGVLAAVADRLMPAGGVAYVEWGVRVVEPHPRRAEKIGDVIPLADELIARHGPKVWHGWVPVRRQRFVGEWAEVPE